MVLDFYYIPGSAPCRAVLMTAKAVGVELNLKLTNLMAGDHLKPEFVAVSLHLFFFLPPFLYFIITFSRWHCFVCCHFSFWYEITKMKKKKKSTRNKSY